jgi:hypothetical protein
MNERGGELMKPASFSNGSLLAPYPLMKCLRKNETQLVGLEFKFLVKALRPSGVHIYVKGQYHLHYIENKYLLPFQSAFLN